VAVREVSVVSVPVSDQDRAKEFYVEKLGFELTRERFVLIPVLIRSRAEIHRPRISDWPAGW
jgi:hypothetical protein